MREECGQVFTSLSLLKPAMRSTMTSKRLNGLTIMFVHRNLASCLDVQDVHGGQDLLPLIYQKNDLSASKDNFDRRRTCRFAALLLC